MKEIGVQILSRNHEEQGPEPGSCSTRVHIHSNRLLYSESHPNQSSVQTNLPPQQLQHFQ